MNVDLAVKKGKIVFSSSILEAYVKVASENPARAYGLYPRKGIIQVGSDADLTIVDLKKEARIKSEKLHSKNPITPFDGWKVHGTPIYTVVRGNVVMEKGEVVGPPKGTLISPSRGTGS